MSPAEIVDLVDTSSEEEGVESEEESVESEEGVESENKAEEEGGVAVDDEAVELALDEEEGGVQQVDQVPEKEARPSNRRLPSKLSSIIGSGTVSSKPGAIAAKGPTKTAGSLGRKSPTEETLGNIFKKPRNIGSGIQTTASIFGTGAVPSKPGSTAAKGPTQTAGSLSRKRPAEETLESTSKKPKFPSTYFAAQKVFPGNAKRETTGALSLKRHYEDMGKRPTNLKRQPRTFFTPMEIDPESASDSSSTLDSDSDSNSDFYPKKLKIYQKMELEIDRTIGSIARGLTEIEKRSKEIQYEIRDFRRAQKIMKDEIDNVPRGLCKEE
jgi:hypothetical protein